MTRKKTGVHFLRGAPQKQAFIGEKFQAGERVPQPFGAAGADGGAAVG
jgi:hypothetical protein